MKMLILILLLFVNLSAQNRWEKLSGPGGGIIAGLYSKGDTILAGTGYDKGKIFYSFNRGLSWKMSEIKISYRFEEFLFTDDGGVIAAANMNGLYRSYDLENWEKLNVSGNFWSLGKDKLGNLYAGTDDSRIFMSTDHGNSWSFQIIGKGRINDFLLTEDSLFFVSMISTAMRKNYALNKWETVFTDTIFNTHYKLFSDNSGNIYSYAWLIFISKDSGKMWENIPTGSFFYGNSMYEAIYNSRIIGAFGDERGWFGDGWGAAVSDEYGLNWKWSQNGLPPKITGYSLTSSGNDTYLGTNAAGVFKSTDFGESWFPVNNGIYAAQTIKVIIDKEGVLYAASWSNGLSRSTDNGESWEMINNGVNNVYFYSIVSDEEGNLMAGSEQGVYRSTDKGNNWVETTLVGDNFGYELQIDRYNRIYCLTFGDGLYRTTNLGENWERLDKGFVSPYVFGMAIDGQDNLYAGTSGGVLYKSVDDGENWTKLYQSSVSNAAIGAISISPAGDIFITNHGEGILRSTDEGDSWELVKEDRGSMYPNFIIAINSKGEIFTKGSNEHIYRSTDNGEKWEDITSNLTLVNVNNFTLDENDNLYLATDESVWRSNPDSLTSIAEDENLTPREYSLSQNYPNPFNPNTIIKYQIPVNGLVSLKIYDILGKEISTLVNEEKSAGRYEVNFNASDLASGVYIYRVQVNEFVESRKMILMK